MVELESKNLSFEGELEIIVYDKDGNIKEKRELKNLITYVGKAQIMKLMSGLDTTAFTYMAIGTGTTAETVNDTALENELYRKAVTSITTETSNFTDDTIVFGVTYSAVDGLTGVQPITEAGIFNAPTGGVMLNRRTFAVVNIDFDAGDTLRIVWRVRALP